MQEFIIITLGSLEILTKKKSDVFSFGDDIHSVGVPVVKNTNITV